MFPTTGEYSNYGITQKLLISINYFVKDPKDLTMSDARNIYQQEFWQKYRLDLFTSNKIARKILDMFVNMGPRQAALCVQDALGLEGHMRDGILGPLYQG
jgi:lysozyme family protein